MKKQNLLSFLLIGLLFISITIQAENTEGRFRLNEGDWFEMELEIPFNFSAKRTPPINFFKMMNDVELSYRLRYQLQKQRSNGNQIYNVSIKRIQCKMYSSSFDVWLGYDSYYPPYRDKLSSAESFLQSDFEVTPSGEIIRYDSISGITPILVLDEISPRKRAKISIDYKLTFPPIIPKIVSYLVSYSPPKSGTKWLKIDAIDTNVKIETQRFYETESYNIYEIIANDSISSKTRYLKKERIPVDGDLIQLVDASFPLPANTVVKGKLTDQINQDITISLDGDNDETYFNKKNFKTNSDGTFNCPIFINKPFYITMNIGDETISSFIEPNDTLEILNIPHNVKRVSFEGTFYDHPTKQGYLLNSDDFKGKAAYNAKLSVEMNEWMGYMPMPKDVQAYLDYRKEITKNINELILRYKGKASESCIDYFRSKWNYFLAADKLYFKENQEATLFEDLKFDKKLTVKKAIEYPADFFLEIDTLASIMYPYPWCTYYQHFNRYAYDFRKNRLGIAIGGLDDDFWGNYYFSRASLKGFPLYTSLAKAIDLELRNGSASASRIEPFYQDFINNCNNPALTEPLANVHKTISELAAGKIFPVQSFILKDSTVFNLANYKGKPVCLVILNAPKSNINQFKREIEKFKPDEVEFLFVSRPNTYMNQTPVDSAILAMPNVKVIDIVEQNLKNRVLLSTGTKIFMLAKRLQIVEDDVKDPNNHIGSNSLEKAVKKAIQANRYSEAQMSSIYKTAGWSLGSILFTLLVGLWVYRVRVRKLKKQEALKRQIKELEIKAIRSQMNPHFIFNALNSIQSLVNSNQHQQTNIYLAKFSVLLRGVLNNSEKSLVSLSDELEAVRLYCELEQLRFEFELNIEIDQNLDRNLIEIPGMIIQPLAENAVVHGMSTMRDKGILNIQIAACHEGLRINVIDNGVGLPFKQEDKLSQKGYGLKLVQERLAILSQHGKQAKLTVENNCEGTGTTTTLIIPID